MVKLSIVILNYNDQHHLPECLECLKDQTFKDFEVIIVDNGSTRKSNLEIIEIIKLYQNDLNLKFFRVNRNLFFAGGCNKGIKEAKGKFICSMNNDTAIPKDFLEISLKYLKEIQNYGFLSPITNYYKEPEDYRFLGVKFTPFSLKFYRPLRRVNLDIIRETGYVGGAAMFSKKEVLNQVGFLDEIFFSYYEEVDWHARAKFQFKMKNYIFPGTLVYHKEGRIKQVNIYNYYLHLRNYQIFIWKNFRLSNIFLFYCIHYPWYIFKSYAAAFLKKRFHRFKVIHRAIFMGFLIGLRRKFNRNCKKIILREYKYVKKLEKKIIPIFNVETRM